MLVGRQASTVVDFSGGDFDFWACALWMHGFEFADFLS